MKQNYSAILLTFALWATSSHGAWAQMPEVNLYGHLVSSQQTNVKTGIYQFTTGQSAAIDAIAEITVEPNAGAVRVNNLYYVFNISNQGSYGKEYNMYIYDIAGNYTLITRATTSEAFMSESQVIAHDPTSGTMYCTYNDPYYGNRLATIDVSKRTRTVVASLDYNKFITLSFDNEGKLYGINNVGTLYEINKTTGETRYIGSTGVSPADYQQAATFTRNDNKTLYWADCEATQGALYAVDVNNAQATLIKTFPHEEEFASLWAGSNVVLGGAPAKATDLTATFANGALTGNFSFKAPQVTHDGQALTGNLNYSVKIDGKEVATGTIQTGATVDCPLTTTQGTHDFAVTLSNNVGEGEEATVKSQYIGKDTPGMVQNVTLTRGNDTKQLILTWDAPTQGTHGGYFNPSEVKYTIRRMPADVIVSHEATSPFSEKVDATVPQRCFYEVTPYVDENTQGVPMSSNKIMIGTPFTVPYLEDFTQNEHVNSFTIEDANNDGTTWEYMYEQGYMRIFTDEKEKNEWLFTPFITFEEKAEYKLSFDVQSIDKEKIEVKMGNDAASKNMTKTLMQEFDVTKFEWVTKECTFTADATMPWFIGFHCTTTDAANSLALYLDNIKIEKIADAPLTGLQDIDNECHLLTIDGRYLTLNSNKAKLVKIFHIDGREKFNGTLNPQQSIALNSGLYIVNIDNKAIKVLIK